MVRPQVCLGVWAAVAALGICCLTARATDYQVGPGQTYSRCVDVPWESLTPGDTVYIHWRSAAQGGDYHEKVNLTAAGALGKPIRIVGVPGPNGARPCLNGADAITRTVNPAANSTYYYGNQERGVLCFSETAGGDWNGHGADYWDVSGLKITGARPYNNFTNSLGQLDNYQRAEDQNNYLGSAAAGVFIDRGNYLHFTNMELTDNNNGFFSSSDNYGAASRHVHDCILEKSLLYGNGKVGSDSVHNAYCEVANMTYRWNYFGPLLATGTDGSSSATGTHIKDRGANVMIEGNYFADANVTMYLDPPENSLGWMDKQPGWNKITVRNNVIVKPDSRTYNGQDLILFASDPSLTTVRTADVISNTFLISSSQNTNWGLNVFDVGPEPQTINFDKNVFLRYPASGTPSEVRFCAKFAPTATTATVLNIGTGNYMSGQPTIYQQTSGAYSNGTITVNGFSNLNMLSNMTQPQLESLLGINLHNPSAANYGQFSETGNSWFLAHGAGAALAPLPGDCNEDGKVTFADYIALANNFGTGVTGWAQGDFNGDFVTSFADYIALANNFGQSVPEPATLGLLLLGGLGLIRRRR